MDDGTNTNAIVLLVGFELFRKHFLGYGWQYLSQSLSFATSTEVSSLPSSLPLNRAEVQAIPPPNQTSTREDPYARVAGWMNGPTSGCHFHLSKAVAVDCLNNLEWRANHLFIETVISTTICQFGQGDQSDQNRAKNSCLCLSNFGEPSTPSMAPICQFPHNIQVNCSHQQISMRLTLHLQQHPREEKHW